MLQVAVPIDLGIVAQTRSGAFAGATPLRIDRLVEIAVTEALGARAPREKRDRVVARTLRSFAAGDFAVEVDGRVFTRPDDVVVAGGTVTLRFFACPSVSDELRAS